MSKNLSRRRFLQSSAIVGAMANSPWNLVSAQSRRVERVGLQLYTLRTAMAEDFEGTLAKVAELGYKEMEFAGYHGRSPAEVRRTLDGLGMTSPAAHIQLAAIRNNLEGEIEAAVTLGQKYVVVPAVPGDERGYDDFLRHAETLNRAGVAAKAAGLKMGYHNHSFEFEVQSEGETGYGALLRLCEEDLVSFELDLFWAVNAGQSPTDIFAAHPGRFQMVHVKDRAIDGTMVDVGSGLIDFAEIFSHSDAAGIEHYFVEHDTPGDGIRSVSNSISAINAIRF